jgi:hypothetical protein
MRSRQSAFILDMPVTPFHFGVGLFAKGVAPRHVSLGGFVLTQIAIDCESGYFLFRGEWPAHRFFHTIIGATLLCTAVVLVTAPLLHRLSTFLARRADSGLARWLPLAAPPTWPVLMATIALGVLGHVIPDAIMHADMHPFAPFTDWNPSYRIVSLGGLHLALIVAGLLGLFFLSNRRANNHNQRQ